MKVDAQNQQMQDKQAHEAKVSKLNEEISALKKKLTEVTGDHKEKEQALRKVFFPSTYFCDWFIGWHDSEHLDMKRNWRTGSRSTIMKWERNKMSWRCWKRSMQ